jgi:hypothetical protein
MAGFANVPIIRIEHLTAAQKRAYLLADNKIQSLAGYDREALSLELAELLDLLPAEGLDVDLTGFEAAEIDLLSADLTSGTSDEEELPIPPAIPCSQLGDLWRLGKHRLLCGDYSYLNHV